MPRVLGMRPNVRKSIGRRRKQPLPRIVALDGRQRRQELVEVMTEASHTFAEGPNAPAPRDLRSIAAAEYETAIGRPARIVVRPRGIPEHHIAEADRLLLRAP